MSLQSESSRSHPRRRLVLDKTHASPADSESKMCLKKGETFNTPTSAPSSDCDPVLSIRSLPARSPTSLESIAAAEERMTSILGRLTLESTGDTTPGGDYNNSLSMPISPGTADESRALPIPDTKKFQSEHDHEYDSGLGTSVSSLGVEEDELAESSVESSAESSAHVSHGMHDNKSAITGSISTFHNQSPPKRQLGRVACKQIEQLLIVPILKEPRLKPFHSLVRSIPQRIINKQIVCLRDVEKTLLWLTPNSLRARKSYLDFSEFTIQCLHTSASHLNDRDQRLPADRPYTNSYFVDLVSQVRRHAAMLREQRQRVQTTQETQNPKSDKENAGILSSTISLEGGLSKNGKAAELVVMKDGKPISLATGEPYEVDASASTKRTIPIDGATDEGVERSMARRKKDAPPMDIDKKCPDCDKVFKRPCDYTKHENTHTRPWKCKDSKCVYYTKGWATAKERDRHMNDRHSEKPTLFRCTFHNCTYASKRSSNCKQHMEKSHGWVYVRSKNNGRSGSSKRGSSLQATPMTPNVSTPASKVTDFASPIPGPTPGSPTAQNYDWSENTAFNFAEPPLLAQGDDFPLFGEASPYLMNDVNSFPNTMNLTAFQNQFEAADPNGLIPALEMHRQSMNSMAVPSAESVPDLMGPMPFDGSPLTGAESINFDQEWSSLEYPMNEDYTVMPLQIPPSHSLEEIKGFTNDYDHININPLSYGSTGNISGLSPSAQGNAMLYSPDSCNAGDILSERYEFAQSHGNEYFALYNQNAQMDRTAHSMLQALSDQTAHYHQLQQDMSPSLDQERAFQGMPYSGQSQGNFLPRA